MRLISCHRGELQTLGKEAFISSKGQAFTTGLPAIDGLLPAGKFACGAIHEVLSEPEHGLPLSFAVILARAAHAATRTGVVIWCDPQGWLYPPAAAASGLPLDRLYLLKPASDADQVWAVAECLRCRGVSAVMASVGRLSRIEARRLQLAAEHGGGVGILLRSAGHISSEYAAATRWLVRPIPGQRTLQRWMLQLVHGHGGCVGQSATLEVCRETHHVRVFTTVGDRSVETQATCRRA